MSLPSIPMGGILGSDGGRQDVIAAAGFGPTGNHPTVMR